MLMYVLTVVVNRQYVIVRELGRSNNASYCDKYHDIKLLLQGNVYMEY